ncbi:cellulose binding domain-containing protein [Solwaraspora sp. WMMD406]|uniref:cellulose binding domain-containing protein n=1 Tax=Solwaraspora sp. WMMD406 TaxID=3016095 RepID=UPI0024176FAD|nr:cellulose binding domain-containing protein [Solwaraspora sp. WMMD406]MDG4767553.1 cellulose binding domain-containing protein [Solwaraspora sp. WMMD406]
MKVRPFRAAVLVASLSTAVVTATILFAPAASAATAAFVRTASWSSGYEAKFTVTNDTSTAISSWTVQFDLPAGTRVSSFWDARLTTSGQRITATNHSWNGVLAPGASTSFGFVASGTGDPINCTVNGGSCGGGPAPTTPPTTAPPTSPPPTSPPPVPAGMKAAPYIYDWGNAPAPATVMSATGIRWFTRAFILSGGGCTPAWDGARPLLGGSDAAQIAAIRAAGGDIIPSVGGWSGNKLGPNCASAAALAGALQQVIDAYQLRAIDMDVENIDEFENETVQDRILGALKILKQNNPGLITIVTIGTATTGPTWWGTRMINRAAQLQAGVDVWTIMPFNFGGHADMYGSTVSAATGLRDTLKAAFGWNDTTAYARMGISGMNGRSDQGEITTVAQWTQIRDWARARGLARLAFWSVNRDRPCPGAPLSSGCSSIDQRNWEFTAITAGFQ